MQPRRTTLAGCIVQLIGVGVFFAGCVVLLAILGGYRRPLRSLGISTSPESGISLLALGALIALLGSGPVQMLERVAREAMEHPKTREVESGSPERERTG